MLALFGQNIIDLGSYWVELGIACFNMGQPLLNSCIYMNNLPC